MPVQIYSNVSNWDLSKGVAKRWEGMLELVFLLVTLCLLASSHHTYVQLLPTVRTHCNRNYKSIEREMRKRKLGWSAIVFANSVGETTHCLLSIPAKNGGYGLLVRCSPAEMAHRHKTGLARVLCSRERVSQKNSHYENRSHLTWFWASL